MSNTTTNTTSATTETNLPGAISIQAAKKRTAWANLWYVVSKSLATLAGFLDTADTLVEASHRAANSVNAAAGALEATAMNYEQSVRSQAVKDQLSFEAELRAMEDIDGEAILAKVKAESVQPVTSTNRDEFIGSN